MKQLEKMSLANVKSKLTRKEMSNIMAGSGSSSGSCISSCSTDYDCNCNPCNTSGYQRCATFVCESSPGFWTSRRACSCR